MVDGCRAGVEDFSFRESEEDLFPILKTMAHRFLIAYYREIRYVYFDKQGWKLHSGRKKKIAEFPVSFILQGVLKTVTTTPTMSALNTITKITPSLRNSRSLTQMHAKQKANTTTTSAPQSTIPLPLPHHGLRGDLGVRLSISSKIPTS